MQFDHDVVIVGGGPAGLSAALILGRSRRRVLVCDSGQYRNAVSHALRAFLTRDGVPPDELRRVAREELARYPDVELCFTTVTDAERLERGFALTLEGGGRVTARALVLATGVVDVLPEIPGLAERYGRGVHHCPYCDGWELRDRPLAIYGRGDRGRKFALELLLWTDDVVLVTDGPGELGDEARAQLGRNGVVVREERLAQVRDADGGVELVFAEGPPLGRAALFVATTQRERSSLPARLGVRFTENRLVETGKYETTGIHNLFVVGDASGTEMHVAIVAASEGAQAAMAVNAALLRDDLV